MTATDPSARGFQIGFGPRHAWVAVTILAATLTLIIAGLMAPGDKPRPSAKPAKGDWALYLTIVERVRGGEGYYPVALDEQRRNNYPTRPFIAVRPPTLAYIEAALANELAQRAALMTLAAAAVGAWMWRLRALGLSRVELAAGLLLLGTGATIGFGSKAYLFHEDWAGLLMALSLALRRPGAWRVSLAVGLLAVFVRELAAAYLVAMAALAWRDGDRREAAAWLSALGLAGLGLMFHASQVHAYSQPRDPQSQGWAKVGGWWFVLKTMRWNAVLLSLHPFVTAILAPFAVLGLAVWRGPLGDRVALVVLGYCVAFLVIGRPENSYWGMLIAPLWPLGLLVAPRAVWALLGPLRKSDRDPPLSTVQSA